MTRLILAITAAAAIALFTQASTTAERAPGTYKIDAVHSSLIFKIKHVDTANFYGRFNDVSGSFTLDDDPAKCSVQIDVKVASVDTHDNTRDGHLKSPDFFNAKEFPTLTFKSTSFAKTGDGAYDVSGDLTIHGVTKAVTVKAAKTGFSDTPKLGARCGVETTFTLKRSDFGMKFMLEQNALGDEVTIIASLEGVQ
jgi:polyisoprenoid-binding protein YceI